MNSKSKNKKEKIFNPAMIVLSIILQVIAINSMMAERGTFQFGGEWLIIPLFLLLNIIFEEAVFQMKKEANALFYVFKKYKIAHRTSTKKRWEKANCHTSKLNAAPTPSIKMIRTNRKVLKPVSKQYMHAS